MVLRLLRHTKGQPPLQNKGRPPPNMWDADFIKWGGGKVSTRSELIRFEWNVWNLRHPGVGARATAVHLRPYQRIGETVAVPKCSIAAWLRHVVPHSMAMLSPELVARGDDPHTDERVSLLCVGS